MKKSQKIVYYFVSACIVLSVFGGMVNSMSPKQKTATSIGSTEQILCSALEKSLKLNTPCVVNQNQKTMNIVLNSPENDPSIYCDQIIKAMDAKKIKAEKNWTLNIATKSQDENTTSCVIPTY